MKPSDLTEISRGRILFPRFSGGKENFTSTESPPRSVPWSPPGILQELIRAPGTGTMRKWASISILAINFPGMLHGFSSEGWNSISHTWICQAGAEVLQKKEQMWFGKVQMSVQRVNTHRGRSSSSGFKPCPAAWTLGAVPAWGHSGSHLRELLGTLKDSRDFFFLSFIVPFLAPFPW